MEDRRDQILNLIQSKKKNTVNKEMLEDMLGLSRSQDRIALEKDLEEMEEEHLIFRGRGNTFSTWEQEGLVSGVIHINKRGIGYLDRDGQTSLLFYEDKQMTAMNGDTVLARIDDEDDQQAYGSVVAVLKRAKDHVIGTFLARGKGLRFVPDDERLAGKPLSFHVPENLHIVGGEKVLFRIRSYATPMQLEFVKKIGYKDDPGVDILSILYDYDIDPEFPQDALAQAEAMEQEVSEDEKQGRRDLTDVITVTIDGDDSKDFDDAVSVERNGSGWILKVSIADVSHYVTENSPLDIEARKRGCSTYVTDRVVPMLPHLLSNGICSLNPHVERLTNTCEMEIAKDGRILKYEIYPSVIRSSERMTYHNVNLILDGDKAMMQKYAHLGTLFTDLRDCADAIRAERNRKGAIDFDTPESIITVDDKGRPIDVKPTERGHAERMIEDCMIAANVSVADFMNHNEWPCMYRIHERPQVKRMKDYAVFSYLMGHPFHLKTDESPKDVQIYLHSVENTDEYPVLASQMLRCMQKARYDSKCLGHFGLAEREYLHFTSPIRRYPDLIVHRMLRKYYFEQFDGDKKPDEKKIDEYAEQSSVRERASQSAEFDCEDMKKAEYMAGKIGEVYEGLIDSVMSYGFYVQLPNTVEGLVGIASLHDDYYIYDESRMCLRGEHTHNIYQVGQKVRIRVMGASKEAGSIDFAIDSPRNSRNKTQETSHDFRKHKMRARGARKVSAYPQRQNSRHSRTDGGKKTYRHDSGRRRDYNGRRNRNGR